VLHKRERELGYLDARYTSDRAELAVLYGRRRVGKTTLAYHWAQDKPHLFFFATQDDNATLLRRFSQLSKSAAGEDAAPAALLPRLGHRTALAGTCCAVPVSRGCRLSPGSGRGGAVGRRLTWSAWTVTAGRSSLARPAGDRSRSPAGTWNAWWSGGSAAHWDVHYAVYARNLAPGLRDLSEHERNVHLFTPADVVGSESE